MFKPLSLYIGLRYTRAKRRNHFISFIALSSMLGIAIGVAVLITVLSVMNGFDQQIRERVFSLARQVTVSNFHRQIHDWQKMEHLLSQQPGVAAAEPYASAQGMVASGGLVHPTVVSGIKPEYEAKISKLPQLMIAGSLKKLTPGAFNIVLGKELANQLGVYIGDKVTLVLPEASLTPAGVIPRFKRFTVAGIFDAGSGFGFDSLWTFINLTDAQKLFKLGNAVSGFWLRVDNVYAAPRMSVQIIDKLPRDYTISDWSQEYGAFFQAISMEKTMMALILLLLIAIATFNLVSSLVMVVNDKRSDIAILRTFGATPRTIMGIFIVQGSVIGFIGTLLGVLGGLALALNVTALVAWLEHVTNIQFISSNVYFVNYLPSKIEASDVIKICIAALVMSLLATLYPAWRASRTQPAEALRYE